MNLIESNFREIHRSLKYPGEQKLPLVANLSGTRIYDSRYGWGRLWRCFYLLAEWTTGSADLHLHTLKMAILHTHALFLQEMAKIQLALKSYMDYLKISAKGYSVNESAFFPARGLISAWNVSTAPFLRLINKTGIKHPLSDLLSDVTELPFKSAHTDALRRCQKIIDLEGFLGRPLPLCVIKKIARQIPLNAIDQKDLDKWISRIDSSSIPVAAIHKAIKAIADIFAKKNSGLESDRKPAAEMELFLEGKGCKAFQQNDDKHLQWRQNLKSGHTLTVNGIEITLGMEIFPDISGSDRTRAYTIERDPKHIVLIANNRAALPLRDLRMRKENDTDIKPALAIGISIDGRIAIFEHLKKLDAMRWTSSGGRISPEDTPMIHVLSGLVQGFIKQNSTPRNFSSASLMLNEQGKLNFVKPSSKGPFDFNAIEDFFMACAGDNQRIFSELMERSGLITHSTAKFYQDVVRNTLGGDETAPDDLAGIYKISDPKIVDRAAVLSETIKGQMNKLMMHCREHTSSTQQPEQRTKQFILRTYLDSKHAGTFGG